jgi:hypothetical protein
MVTHVEILENLPSKKKKLENHDSEYLFSSIHRFVTYSYSVAVEFVIVLVQNSENCLYPYLT